MVETIEHIPPGQLSRVEQAVFGTLAPATLIVTTPNVEYNPLYGLAQVEVVGQRLSDDCLKDRIVQ